MSQPLPQQLPPESSPPSHPLCAWVGENAIKATVTRQVYLGASRDYVVETADGNSLRLVTPTETAVDKGREVWLILPPDRCRALSR